MSPALLSPIAAKKQLGMTLIEIMIALLIGAFLLGGILQIFIGSKQTNKMQEGLSRLQENGRFAMDFLSNNIRMAGFIGCSSQDDVPTNTLNTPTGFLYDFSKAINGFESTSESAWTPALDATVTSPLGGSDVITLRKADSQGFTVTAHASSTANLTLDAATATTDNLKSAGFLTSAGANNCALAVVSNCTAATIFQVSAIAGNILSHNAGSGCTPDNSTNDLSDSYVNGQVYAVNTVSYYVRTGSGGQPSLYRRVGLDDAEELVEGIEQMQILYGVETDAMPDGTPNYYVSADNVADMSQIVSIRISLLAVTQDDNLAAQPLPYTYNGVITTPTDRKIRRVFNTTIALRNRLG